MDEPRGTGADDARASGAAATRVDAARRRRYAGRSFQILAVLLLPGAFIRYAHGNLELNDFSVYYTAAHAVLEGLDPYATRGPNGRPYLYPPGFAVLLAPLAALPYPAAAVLWTVLGFAAVLTSLCLCLDLLGVARGATAWTLGGFTLLCSGRMLDGELGNGQANFWVLLGIAASVWLVARRRAALGGFALALAIVAKLTPLLLVPYYAVRREWRACAGVAAGIAILAGLLPALALGPRAALEANRAWVRTVAQPNLPDLGRTSRQPSDAPARTHGYSLRSYVRRLLTFTRAEAHYDEPIFVNAVAWSARTADAIYLGLVLLALVGLALALGTHPPRDPPRWLLEVACVATTMVLISPLSRKAHFVVLLLPFAYGVKRAVEDRSRAAAAWIVPPALVFGLTSQHVIGDHAAALALAWGSFTLATLWLWVGALLASWRGRRQRLG
jgi:hypothetical protein